MARPFGMVVLVGLRGHEINDVFLCLHFRLRLLRLPFGTLLTGATIRDLYEPTSAVSCE
jgi:hypothetical protein